MNQEWERGEGRGSCLGRVGVRVLGAPRQRQLCARATTRIAYLSLVLDDGSPTSSATLSLMPEASSQGQRRLSMPHDVRNGAGSQPVRARPATSRPPRSGSAVRCPLAHCGTLGRPACQDIAPPLHVLMDHKRDRLTTLKRASPPTDRTHRSTSLSDLTGSGFVIPCPLAT